MATQQSRQDPRRAGLPKDSRAANSRAWQHVATRKVRPRFGPLDVFNLNPFQCFEIQRRAESRILQPAPPPVARRRPQQRDVGACD